MTDPARAAASCRTFVLNTCSMNTQASPLVGRVATVGMNKAILVRRQTMTSMESLPLDKGSGSIESIEIEDHGWSGIGSGMVLPHFMCR